MSTPIKTVGVVGTGVIGASWTLLFLARGCNVVVSDPSPTAEAKLAQFIEQQWPVIEKFGLHPSASKQNYKFVKDITPDLPSLDFVQEVWRNPGVNQDQKWLEMANISLLECT
jgi:3-hydroxyacyl-CoA dehydrogenase